MTCILYVDDSRAQLESVRGVLSAKGHEVRTASNADEAIAQMQDGRVELGLIDYHMPEASGPEVLRQIRERTRPAPEVRFFLYTTDAAAQAECRRQSFHGAILQKGDGQALVAQLEPVLRILKLAKFTRR